MSWINWSCIGNTHKYKITKRREHDRLSALLEQARVSSPHSSPLEGDTFAITAPSSLKLTYMDTTQVKPAFVVLKVPSNSIKSIFLVDFPLLLEQNKNCKNFILLILQYFDDVVGIFVEFLKVMHSVLPFVFRYSCKITNKLPEVLLVKVSFAVWFTLVWFLHGHPQFS